jgi:putative salt-induced outer membrane protein YdiY
MSQDVLVLKNGDRISGEINRIWDGEISIEPEYSDEFDIDLIAVDHIISDREFEIELEDGREVVATMGGVDASGQQVLDVGSEAIAIELADFLEVDEPEDYYDWGVNADISADLNKGNTESANSKLRADAMFKHGDHRHTGEATYFREEVANIKTKEQDLFRYSYNWLFRDPWFLAGNLSFERDPIIELTSRVIASAGLGRDIWNTPRRGLSFNLGVGAQEEDIGNMKQSNGVATWALQFRYDLFNGDLELFHNHNINSNISGRTNTSYRTTTGLRYEITDLLYANFSIDYDYETDPVPGILSEDITVLFGFGAEFD